MLITCPECNLQISDKASFCPHCGYPMTEQAPRKYTKPTKRAHRKLPNGFGSITEIKGRYLRNPFFVRICVGKTDQGRPILRSLKPQAYFKTYNEAYEALVEYHKLPSEKAATMTVADLYAKWSPVYFEQVSTSMRYAVQSCWKKSERLYPILIRELKAGEIREVIDEEPSANMKQRIKYMFDAMLDYALEYDWIERNVSKSFKLSKNIITEGKTVKKGHKSLTVGEVNRMWSLLHEPYVDIILIGIYTGMRPQELLNIRNEDIHFEQGYLIGGMKTAAGKNRIIPIHEKIKPLFRKRINVSEWLFNDCGRQITYSTYKYWFVQLLPGHTPHDTRKTFITFAKQCNMDDVAIKRIVGHQLDVTEGVYTERSTEWLIEEMHKLDIQTI